MLVRDCIDGNQIIAKLVFQTAVANPQFSYFSYLIKNIVISDDQTSGGSVRNGSTHFLSVKAFLSLSNCFRHFLWKNMFMLWKQELQSGVFHSPFAPCCPLLFFFFNSWAESSRIKSQQMTLVSLLAVFIYLTTNLPVSYHYSIQQTFLFGERSQKGKYSQNTS